MSRQSLLVKALHCKNSGRPPVWLMRQAGRYLPAYRKLRENYSFLELCKNPDLAVQVTELPISAIDPDAAILFADILLILEAIGKPPLFDDHKGPFLVDPIQSKEEIYQLQPRPIQETLPYIPKAIKLFKQNNSLPLIGFCGAPFTLATYLIEGKTGQNFSKTKEWIYKDPDSIHHLLDLLTEMTIEYIFMQIEAGVDAIQIFDSWAEVLPYPLLYSFCLQYLQKIKKTLKDTQVPIILFARGSSLFFKELCLVKPHAISLDWSGNLAHVKSKLPPNIAIQGNLDPHVLFANEATLIQEVTKLLEAMKGFPGYIFNLGHGILPHVDVNKVRLLVDTVKSHG